MYLFITFDSRISISRSLAIYIFFHVSCPFFSIFGNIMFLRTVRFTLSRHTVSGVFSRPLFRLITLALQLLSSFFSAISAETYFLETSEFTCSCPKSLRFDRSCVVSQLTRSGFALRIHMQSTKSRSPQREYTPITTMIIRVLDTRLRNVYTFSAHFLREINYITRE